MLPGTVAMQMGTVTTGYVAYDISGSALGSSCPECGLAVAESLGDPNLPLPPHPRAVPAMIFGILGLAVCAPLGMVGFWLGHQARKEIDAGRYSAASRPMASAGYWCGIAATAIVVIYVTIFVPVILFR